MYYLGLSLHYLTDLTQPMHAALFTEYNPLSKHYHSGYETYAMQWTNETNPPPIPFDRTIAGVTFAHYIETAAWNALGRSETLLSDSAIEKFNLFGFGSQWSGPYGAPTVQASLEDGRRIVSQYLMMCAHRTRGRSRT